VTIRWVECHRLTGALRRHGPATDILQAKQPKRWRRSYNMAKRIPDGIKVEMSSGNVFANLGLPDAEQLKIKSGLVIEIKLTPTTDTVGHRTLAVT